MADQCRECCEGNWAGMIRITRTTGDKPTPFLMCPRCGTTRDIEEEPVTDHREMKWNEERKLYASDDGWVMRREQGQTENGNEFANRWVLRDADGIFVDVDQYRHDLEGRYKLRLTGDTA